MEIKVVDNHKLYLERLEFYRQLGYDQTQEREFILDCAGRLDGSILEIGTGKGHFTLALAKRGVCFISVDMAAQEQEIAALNLEYYGLRAKADLRLMDAGSLAFSAQSFDLIFCVNVFHHLKEPSKALKEMTRVLRSKGRIVLSDFNAEGMAIINHCHEIEGKILDRLANNFEDAVKFFTGARFRITRKESKCQAVIIARR